MATLRVRALTLLCVIASICSLNACRDASKWVRRMGFTPLQPPSGLLAPGAIIMRRHGLGPVRLLCTSEESLGVNFAAAKSRTIGGRFKRSSKAGWRLSADALKQVKVAAKSEAIKNVFVQVDNPFISYVTDTDVLLAAPHRSKACETAMRRRLSDGWQVSLVVSAVRADVSYSVEFDDSADVDVSAKLAQLQAVSATLGGNFKATGESSGSARGLVWGFKDDVALAAIGTSDADVLALAGQVPAPHRKRQSILINDEMLAQPPAEAAAGDDGASWGVASDDDAKSMDSGFVPADASAPVAAEEQDNEVLPEPEHIEPAEDTEPEADTGSTGFVPSSGGAPPSDDTQADDGEAQNPSQPVSPRSRRKPVGDVLELQPRP